VKRKPPAVQEVNGKSAQLTADSNAVRAVIFDFGGVLCFHPTEDRFARIAAALNIPTQRLLEIFWAHRIEYDAGLLDSRAYWTQVAADAGKPLDDELLARLGKLEIELWDNYDRRVFAWAAHLKANGIRTGMLSNLPRSLGEALLATPGLLDVFDHLTLSYRLEIVKPEAAIYHYAAHSLIVPPSQALFLDDKPENVEGARAIGMQAELYTTWEAFLDQAAGRYNLPMLLQSP
jgi:putative hydrolase of the HAD superfamily